MVYNDTTTKNGIIQRYERHCLLGDGVVSGDTTLLKQATADINEGLYDLTNEIIISNDNFDYDDATRVDFPIATTPLTLNRDYQFDNISFLKIKRVDVSWDGTTFYKAQPFDSSTYNRGLGNDDIVDGDFNKQSPYYDPKSFGLWLYPRATASDVSAGGVIRVEYIRAYDEYTYVDTTKEPPITRPFHDLIAIAGALKNPNLPDKQYQKLSLAYANGVQKMKDFYGTRNEDASLSFNPVLQDYS